MSGVTHFERRGGAKKVHPTCPFCELEWRVTPKVIRKNNGPLLYIASFKEHLADHLAGVLRSEKGEVMVGQALDAVAQFAPAVWDNC